MKYKFSKEDLDKMIGKEIQYILTSTKHGHILKLPEDNKERQSILTVLYKSLSRSSFLEGSTPSEKLQSSNLYKLAMICKDAVNLEMFKEQVGVMMPCYAKNWRVLLKLGGLDWKIEFDPGLKSNRPRVNKLKKGHPENGYPQIHKVELSGSNNIVFKSDIELLRDIIINLTNELSELRSLVVGHQHVVNNMITSPASKIKITEIT